MVYRPRHAPIQRLKAQILECFDPSLILAQQQMNDHDPSSYHLFTSAKDAGSYLCMKLYQMITPPPKKK